MADKETKAQSVDKEHSRDLLNTGKQRYWVAVLWNENLIENWEDEADDLIQHPYCYCVHDKDVDSEGKLRKTHTHMIIAFPGPTTYKRALSVYKLLGENAVNKIEGVIDMRYIYNYLIHDTNSCRKKKKHLYDIKERHSCNNFDIGQYEQLSMQIKNEMLYEVLNFVIKENIQNMADFLIIASKVFTTPEYFDVIKTNNSFIEKVCRGNYLKFKMRNEVDITEKKVDNQPNINPEKVDNQPNINPECCPNCGSVNIRKNGKKQGQQRFQCKECSHIFS